MRRKISLLLVLAALCLLVLGGCSGKKLPDGMEEDEVISAGILVMKQLVDGNYEEVCAALREDVRAQTDADAIKAMIERVTGACGSYEKLSDSMATGVTDTEEEHGIAVLRAKFDDGTVIFRIAFDPEMNLIGLDAQEK